MTSTPKSSIKSGGYKIPAMTVTMITHLLMWVILFLFPILINEKAGFNHSFVWYQLLILSLTAAIFYLNYFIIIPHYYFTSKYLGFVSINLILFALISLILKITEPLLLANLSGAPPMPMTDMEGIPFKNRVPPPQWPRNVIVQIVTVGAAIAVKVSGKWREEENRRKQVEAEHLKSEMALLRFQLQPHFFFNTLNNIYSLIASQPKQAQEAVYQLGKLMRHVIYKADKALIPLNEEIEFLKAYIAVTQKRLSPHVKVITNFPSEVSDVTIPPLIMISLIENAFKHGVHANQPCFVQIELSVTTEEIFLNIQNSYFPKGQEDQSGSSGIGVSNLSRRLELIYENNEFDLREYVEANTYHSELRLKNKA